MFKVIYAGILPEEGPEKEGTITVRDVLSRDSVKNFLFKLNDKPRSKEQIFAENLISVDDFSDVHKVGLIKDDGGIFYPTFPIFSADEVRTLETICGEIAVRIGGVIKNQWPTIHDFLEKIASYPIFDRPMMAYFILGSFILDVSMKKYLAKQGILIIPAETHLGYIYFGIDKNAPFPMLHDTTKVETAKYGVFISFGKDVSGLKDITAVRRHLEANLRRVVRGNEEVNFYSLLRHYIQSMFDHMSAVMARVIYLSEDWDRLRAYVGISDLHFWDLIDFMKQMGYIDTVPGKVMGVVPVFLPSDTRYITDLATFIGGLVVPPWEATIQTHREELFSIKAFTYSTVNDMWIYYLMWIRTFPRVLEYLEKEGIVAMPEEGYVKAFMKVER